MKRSDVVRTCQSWVGVTEPNHQFILDIYNSHKPLARGYKVKIKDAWCATFASAALITNGWTGPTECGCEEWIKLLYEDDMWIEDDSFRPQPGDLIFYDWDDNGRGDCTGHADHVGVVETVNGISMTIIEGNNNNAVRRRVISVNSRYIRGFGVPTYESEEEPKPPVPTITPYPVNSGEEAIYRLYNKVSGEHIYITDVNYGNGLIASGTWSYEGIAWIAPKKSDIPIWKLTNPSNGVSMYVSKYKELCILGESGWKVDGIVFHGAKESDTGRIYRAYNPNTGQHLFTASVDEYESVIRAGWNGENVDFYATRTVL